MTFRGRTKIKNSTLLTLSEAKKKLMDLVARRDHTEKELRKKLLLRCEADVVEKTLLWAQEQNWLTSPEKLKTQFAEQLGKRGKGIRKINQKLKELGLETVKSDKDSEIEKAKKLVLAKWSPDDFSGLDYKESQKLKARIMRFLVTRGYEFDVVSLVLKNLTEKSEFKKIAHSEEDNYDDEF
ncbi:MAG: regulatory protein RecX [Bdellovibrionota bacterium]